MPNAQASEEDSASPFVLVGPRPPLTVIPSFCLSGFQAIWENQFYYLFGFLFLVFIILVVSCSQISIVMVYFQLCAEVRCPVPFGTRSGTVGCWSGGVGWTDKGPQTYGVTQRSQFFDIQMKMGL